MILETWRERRNRGLLRDRQASNQTELRTALLTISRRLPPIPLDACPFLKIPENAVIGQRSVSKVDWYGGRLV